MYKDAICTNGNTRWASGRLTVVCVENYTKINKRGYKDKLCVCVLTAVNPLLLTLHKGERWRCTGAGCLYTTETKLVFFKLGCYEFRRLVVIRKGPLRQ